jgi:hypothetical protein
VVSSGEVVGRLDHRRRLDGVGGVEAGSCEEEKNGRRRKRTEEEKNAAVAGLLAQPKSSAWPNSAAS